MKKLICFLLLLSAHFLEVNAFDRGAKKQPHTLALTAIFRDEADYLKEWIEFHCLVGIEHFYLYNNLSQDHYAEVLAPYVQSGLVELFDWPYESQEVIDWTPIQCSAYQDAFQRAHKKYQWLAVIDTDEFIFATQGDDLKKLLVEYESFGALAVNWQMFGTSYVPKIAPHELLIEKLLLKAPVDYAENRFVKSIVQTRFYETIVDPHHAKLKKEMATVTANKTVLKGTKTQQVNINRIRINHYWSRDEDFFFRVKCGRRQKWQEGFDGQLSRLQNLNQITDDAIVRFAPALRQKMGL